MPKFINIPNNINKLVQEWATSYKQRKPDKYSKINAIEAREVLNGRFVEIKMRYNSGSRTFKIRGPNMGYYQSDEWGTICEKVKSRDDYRCVVCNSCSRLVVHHRTYENFGKEELGDLITLCNGCHYMFHKRGKLKEFHRSKLLFPNS